MQVGLAKCLALCLSALAVVQPADANRMTFEAWSDASPDHVVACTFALADDWISLVQAKGLGKPSPTPMRWRATKAEVDALSAGLQALVGGQLGSVDAYGARQPLAPFLSVTWMTRLDDRPVTGLYLQHGLVLPASLRHALASLGVEQSCGFSAKVDE